VTFVKLVIDPFDAQRWTKPIKDFTTEPYVFDPGDPFDCVSEGFDLKC